MLDFLGFRRSSQKREYKGPLRVLKRPWHQISPGGMVEAVGLRNLSRRDLQNLTMDLAQELGRAVPRGYDAQQ